MGVALTASCLSAVAAPYETRILIKTLKVTGSPQPGTPTDTGTAPTNPGGTGGNGDTPTPPANTVTYALQATPPSVDFGAGVTGHQSDVVTVSLRNPNDVAVQVSSISRDTATQRNFGADNDCSAPIAPGASCNLFVSMTPSQVGSLSGAISVVAGGHLTTVGLTGSAVAATKSLANSGWTTLTAEPGRPSTGSVAISNTGNSTVRLGAISTKTPYFSITSNECGTELAPDGYCTVTVQFSPNQAGDFADTLTVPSDATNNASLPLTGQGIAPQPHMDQVSGGYFGTPYVNTTDSTTVVFQNTGQVDTKVGTLTYQGTGGTTAPASTVFNVTSDTCTGASLAPGGTCNVVVALTGKQEGTSYSMSIYPKFGATGVEATSYGYVGGSFHYMSTALTATSLPRTFNSSSPDSTPVTFQASGGLRQRTFTLTSRDSAPGNVNVASTNPAEFIISSNNCLGTLAPNRTCTFVVTFKLATAGQHTGALNIGGATEMTVSLTGN